MSGERFSVTNTTRPLGGTSQALASKIIALGAISVPEVSLFYSHTVSAVPQTAGLLYYGRNFYPSSLLNMRTRLPRSCDAVAIVVNGLYTLNNEKGSDADWRHLLLLNRKLQAAGVAWRSLDRHIISIGATRA